MPYADPTTLCAKTAATRVRPPNQGDAFLLFSEIHNTPAVTDWLCTPGPDHLSELQDQYTHWRRGTPDEPIYILIIESVSPATTSSSPASPSPIGQVSFRFDGHPNVCDLGFWLGETHQNQGHGTALVRLALAIAFERMNADTVIANVKENNERSLAVLERTGFVRSRAPCGSEIAWILTLSKRAYDRSPARHQPEIEWE